MIPCRALAVRVGLVAGGMMLALASHSAGAAESKAKGIRFWNLTSSTVRTLQLSPAGQEAWGPNQCANDPDGSVDHDERLRITGVPAGRYDVRLVNDAGTCVVRSVELKDNGVFSIQDKDLTDCRK
jgi:hypothetical protein